MSAFYSQRGGLTYEAKLPMQEFELKVQGGLCAGAGEGGCNCEILL